MPRRRPQFFYGSTNLGRKIHMGNSFKAVPIGGGKRTIAVSFCGVWMLAWEEGERPPGSRTDEFCKNCFRSFAWDHMVYAISQEEVVHSRLRRLADEAERDGWDINQLTAEIRRVAGVLEDQMPLPAVPVEKKKTSVSPPRLRLVSGRSA